MSFLNNLNNLTAVLFNASMERSRGVFLSRASPVYEKYAVGIHKVEPLGVRTINAGDVGSQAVYPLASNVARKPPLGKLEASGSPWLKFFLENLLIGVPSLSKSRKLSCFSAVSPVNGWNQ